MVGTVSFLGNVVFSVPPRGSDQVSLLLIVNEDRGLEFVLCRRPRSLSGLEDLLRVRLTRDTYRGVLDTLAPMTHGKADPSRFTLDGAPVFVFLVGDKETPVHLRYRYYELKMRIEEVVRLILAIQNHFGVATYQLAN